MCQRLLPHLEKVGTGNANTSVGTSHTTMQPLHAPVMGAAFMCVAVGIEDVNALAAIECHQFRFVEVLNLVEKVKLVFFTGSQAARLLARALCSSSLVSLRSL